MSNEVVAIYLTHFGGMMFSLAIGISNLYDIHRDSRTRGYYVTLMAPFWEIWIIVGLVYLLKSFIRQLTKVHAEIKGNE